MDQEFSIVLIPVTELFGREKGVSADLWIRGLVVLNSHCRDANVPETHTPLSHFLALLMGSNSGVTKDFQRMENTKYTVAVIDLL